MNYLIIPVIILLIIISITLVWFNLPGTFIFLCIVYLVGLFTSFEIITNKILLITLAIFIFLEVLELLLSAITIKLYGGKNSSVLLSFVGGLVGAVIGNLFLPIIGAFIGLIIGSYLAIYFNEKKIGKSKEKATEIATVSTIAYLFSKGLKSFGILVFGIYLLKLII